MHALNSLREKIDCRLANVHAHRRASLWRGVQALLDGGKLWLSSLGRHHPGPGTEKSRIKAIDRLLGNPLLFVQLAFFYAALCEMLLYRIRNPVILVDVTEIRPEVCALTAALAHDGRAVPIYNIVRSKKYISSRKCKRYFLEKLAELLPDGTSPILVTDAGFQSPWFDEVEDFGWDFVGRIRHRTKFLDRGTWVGVKELHARATSRAKNLGPLAFPKRQPKSRRLVLARRPKLKGRKRRTTRGRPGRTTNDKRCSKSAREPWLLATSLQCRAQSVVDIYALRMQIEQNYRDAKNHRWGWALDQTASRTHNRIEVLLLIATLGAVLAQSVGRAGELEQLQKQFQANTVRNRRVLSLFVLGLYLLRPRHRGLLTKRQIQQGMTTLRSEIRTLGEFP